MKTNRRVGIVAVLLIALLALAVCIKGTQNQASAPEEGPSTSAAQDVQVSTEAVDYSDESMWAYNGIGENKDADLFLICPTVGMHGDNYNISLDDEEMRSKFVGALNRQRGIYEEETRMFAPYYRQTSIKAFSLSEDEREQYLDIAYSDVSAAFGHYLKNENDGRPIVLAGFSQGAIMCYRLLQEYFGDEGLRDQLVAAYALGWPCTRELVEEYPQIVPATRADDIGTVICFDCEAPEVEETFINPKDSQGYAINPLNWRTDATPADKSENLGACFTNGVGDITKEVPGLCGAYVDEGRSVVKVPDVDPSDYPALVPNLPEGAYHIYDYLLFYRNLQQNVSTRLDAYLAEHALDQAA